MVWRGKRTSAPAGVPTCEPAASIAASIAPAVSALTPALIAWSSTAALVADGTGTCEHEHAQPVQRVRRCQDLRARARKRRQCKGGRLRQHLRAWEAALHMQGAVAPAPPWRRRPPPPRSSWRRSGRMRTDGGRCPYMDGREGGTAEGEWLASQAGRAPAAQHAEVLPLRGEERKVEAPPGPRGGTNVRQVSLFVA